MHADSTHECTSFWPPRPKTSAFPDIEGMNSTDTMQKDCAAAASRTHAVRGNCMRVRRSTTELPRRDIEEGQI